MAPPPPPAHPPPPLLLLRLLPSYGFHYSGMRVRGPTLHTCSADRRHPRLSQTLTRQRNRCILRRYQRWILAGGNTQTLRMQLQISMMNTAMAEHAVPEVWRRRTRDKNIHTCFQGHKCAANVTFFWVGGGGAEGMTLTSCIAAPLKGRTAERKVCGGSRESSFMTSQRRKLDAVVALRKKMNDKQTKNTEKKRNSAKAACVCVCVLGKVGGAALFEAPPLSCSVRPRPQW